ncbi:hypothetical protein LOK49_LG06G01436 [Camellia lanceoleosa]|uniref:Uncharacterized protein n=1 Tax=Camellia lanceoleosa TaxID=1840588 RepID=A0ACC0HBL6_9ERIC|nr:hypothetical protein LOK49_LG06G01436 [Camellia lanceoleosa]
MEFVSLLLDMLLEINALSRFELFGKLRDGVTTTDLVLTVTQMLRKHGVVGKFVEFYGEGVGKISLADRATIANMSPEYGATMGFFPVDHVALQYLKLTGRSEETMNMLLVYVGDVLNHGSVVIAAITSCTNTSNPSVMLGAGLVAKKVCELGLQVKSWIKTSLTPGYGVVTKYLLQRYFFPVVQWAAKYLNEHDFHIVRCGCTTCIGNSGDLDESVASAISENDIVVAVVLSGNWNLKGRVHPLTRANYLASPPLVVAYAFAGTAQKSKKSTTSKKNQKLTKNGSDEEETNNGGTNGQSSSCYSSEDDSNASHALKGGTTSDSKGPSSALNSNRKTRASRGAATDPQSLYARV